MPATKPNETCNIPSPRKQQYREHLRYLNPAAIARLLFLESVSASCIHSGRSRSIRTGHCTETVFFLGASVIKSLTTAFPLALSLLPPLLPPAHPAPASCPPSLPPPRHCPLPYKYRLSFSFSSFSSPFSPPPLIPPPDQSIFPVLIILINHPNHPPAGSSVWLSFTSSTINQLID